MIYKNSIKILLSNFDIVWKTIVYYILVFLFTGGLCYLCISPIYNIMTETGLNNDIVATYSEFLTNLNLTQLFSSINDILTNFVSIIADNIGRLWINFVGLFFIIFFVRVILCNLTIMASCNSLNYYMGSMNKHGFYYSFGEVFAKNIKVQLLYFVISFPLKVLNYLAFYFALKLFNYSFVISILAIFLIVIGFVLLITFKYILFCGWIPTMVVMNYGIIKSLKVSIKNTFRILPRVLSVIIGVVISIFLANFLIGLFTFMVGFVITIPASYLLYSVLGMVLVYEGQGMRYYVDVYNVITPQKKENSDKLKNMKFII